MGGRKVWRSTARAEGGDARFESVSKVLHPVQFDGLENKVTSYLRDLHDLIEHRFSFEPNTVTVIYICRECLSVHGLSWW